MTYPDRLVKITNCGYWVNRNGQPVWRSNQNIRTVLPKFMDDWSDEEILKYINYAEHDYGFLSSSNSKIIRNPQPNAIHRLNKNKNKKQEEDEKSI